jgi:TolB-like protein/DNA-binding winged helix-turn-helix (wHTH) protein/lipoprotein NlpI
VLDFARIGVVVTETTEPALPKRFGAFEFDSRARQLRKHGHRIRLHGQPLEILGLLLERPAEVVLREELRARLWPEDTFVDFEHSLNAAVNKLREALSDDANNPRFIETVPRRGYRFIAPIERALPASVPDFTNQDAPAANQTATDLLVEKPAAEDPTPSGARHLRRTVWLASTACAFLAVFLVGFNAGGLRQRFWGIPDPIGIRSLAVLPLDNLSGDKRQDYFADGMTDELTTNLAKIRSLHVISRTTMMQYRDAHKSLPQIAQELHVDAVVEGSIMRSGSTVRITAQLIDARHDRHLWAQSYEREVSEILNVQDSISMAIASAVKAELSPEEHESLARQRSVKPEAYEAYLRGRAKLGSQAQNEIKGSVQDFQRAIDLDASYAPAYSGLADSYSLMANYGALLPQEAFPPGKAAALKALSLDPLLAEAHSSLGLVKHYYEWDWQGAEREYKRAIELSPSYAIAHLRYARFLSMVARHDEAIAEIERARELDPLSLVIQSNVGTALYYARRYDAAILESRKTLEIDPNRVWARVFLAMSYEQKGMYPEAIQEEERVKAYFKGAPNVDIAHLYALSGRANEARRILKAMEKENSNASFFIAGGYAALGEKDRAFTWLEKAYEKRDFFLPTLAVNPWMDPLRSDPRFQDLIRRVGLQQ